MLDNIKSIYILKIIVGNINRKTCLKLFRYSKKFQNKLNIEKEEYKTFLQTIIELKMENNKDFLTYEDKFINYIGNKSNYHIYFDDNINEIQRNYTSKKDNVSKIKIFIDKNVKSFKGLFKDAETVTEINFIKFNRKNIINMRSMFSGCKKLNKLNLSIFNTENVTDMGYMFFSCKELKELNLSKFNTSNVKLMNNMFYACSSLEELNIDNFDTSNVTDMKFMFKDCSELKKLNISHFNTKNVINMNKMFKNCYSLRDLKVSNFRLDKLLYNDFMFSLCPKELKDKVRKQINLKEEAFYD